MKLPPSLFDDSPRPPPSRSRSRVRYGTKGPSKSSDSSRMRLTPDTTPEQPVLEEDYFAPQGVWRPRASKLRATAEVHGSGALESGVRSTCAVDQPSYVYVLVHASENRLKIGRSDVPLRRLANLPEAEQVDHVQSFRLALPDRQRAREVESMLHKALASYRLKLTILDASSLRQDQLQRWDGATEWFSLAGMRHVLDLLRALPEFMGRQGAPLESLDGQPYLQTVPLRHMNEADRLRDEASQHNLGQLDHICDALMQVKRHLKISWKGGKGESVGEGKGEDKVAAGGVLSHGGILRIHGYKGWWDLENLTSRMSITDHALWNLKTGKASQSERTCHRTGVTVSAPLVSLVSLIRFAIDKPNDLELVFNHPDRLHTVPAGTDIYRRWMRFLEVLAP